MPHGDSERVKNIFLDALELPLGDERTAFLNVACAGDSRLRAEVERLLAARDATGGVLDASSVGAYLGLDRASRDALSPGDEVGRFRILRLIGKGGMGEVYEASDPEYDRTVALKTIRPEFLARRDFVERFRREIRLAWKVTDPHVCRVYDVGKCRVRDTDTVYLTMELLAGESLGDRLKRGPLECGEGANILRQIASGLAVLHDANIVHRDLKPANVMLVPAADGVRCVITDFGLAHAAEAEGDLLSSTTELMGTPAYMAPEQLAGRKIGPPADIFALGIVMYESLCGLRPFEGDQVRELATQKLFRSASTSGRGAPLNREWELLTLACLERDPARRPSAREVCARLDRLAQVPRRGGARSLVYRVLGGIPRRSPAVYVTAVAGLAAVTIPFEAPSVRAAVLRRACREVPGSAVVCQLPAAKDIAVFPFTIKASAADDRAIAIGLSRYLRDSLHRLRPGPETMCVHLRNDQLADGVVLVLEGEVDVRPDRVLTSFTVREANSGRDPLILRRINLSIPRSEAWRLHSEPLHRLLADLDLPTSGPEWRQWLRWSPTHADSMISYLRGLGDLEQGQFDQAALAFSFAIDPSKDFAFVPAQVALGDAYRLAYNRTRDATLAMRARQAYRRAVPLDRDFGLAGADRSWGELEAALGETQASIERFSNALQLWPFDQSAQRSLSAAYETASQDRLAEKTLRTAVEISPRCWLTHNTLAHFYSRHGRFDEAERELLEVVRLSPRNANAYHNLAFDYIKAGRLDDAIEMASRGIRLREIPLAYSTLGRAYLYRGCTSDAVTNLRKAVQVDAGDYLLWANLSEGLFAVGREGADSRAAFQRTIDLSRAALQKNPTASYARAQLALNLARIGRKDDARREIERALDDAHDSQDVLLLGVEVFELLSDRPRALHELESALRAGLSGHEAQFASALVDLRRDPAYGQMLHRLRINPAADAGGVTPGNAGCPMSPRPGVGLNRGEDAGKGSASTNTH